MTYRDLRNRTFELLEAGGTRNVASLAVDIFISALIIANVLAAVLETVPEYGSRYGEAFRQFELFSVVVFTIEYALRVWSSTAQPNLATLGPLKGRLAFVLRPFSIIDLLAIAPFYLHAVIGLDLRVLRALRLLRLFKLARYSTALATMVRVVNQERTALFGSLLLMMIVLLISSTVMYSIESDAQPDKFGSIPETMWWAMATLTTVGYGDVAPVTPLGKAVGGLVMIFGLAMFALPIGILATGFQNEIHRREFVVTWGMVARVPAFKHLSAPQVAEIMRLLNTRRHRRGETIMIEGEPATEMFFISNGEVEVAYDDQEPRRLAEGDFFGERGILGKGVRRGRAMAATDVMLLVLESADLARILEKNPVLRAQVIGVELADE